MNTKRRNRMTEEEKSNKVERALIPYFGEGYPEKALGKTIERVKKGGKIYFLHIIDEGPTRSVRYMTGELGDDSELVENVKEAREKLQKKATEEHTKKAKKEAAKYGISVEPLRVTGDPAEEVLKAIEEYSIQLVVLEKLREKIAKLLLGDETGYLKEKAPCEILTVS